MQKANRDAEAVTEAVAEAQHAAARRLSMLQHEYDSLLDRSKESDQEHAEQVGWRHSEP